MHKLQLAGSLTRQLRCAAAYAAAAIAATTSTAAMAAPPACAPQAQIAPANQVVNENDLVTLNGQPSKDATSYSWSQTSGPAVTLSSSTTVRPMFTAPAVGPAGATLKFQLRVTGCSPPITSTPVVTTISVLDIPDPNRPPVASATVSPASIFTGYTVTLDGSGSSDPDGNTLSYAWARVDGTAVTLSGANTAMATFTAPYAPYPDGTSLKFRLTVSDGALQSSTDQIVNVLWQNAAPTASISCPASVDEGQDFALNGTASSDPDDGIAARAWSQTLGGPVAVLPADMTTASISASAPLLGSPLATMMFKLEVTDNGGLKDDAECSVVVNDKTAPEAAPTQAPAANAHGWNNSDVTVTWDWFDAGVGLDDSNCSESSTSLGEGKPIVLEASCSDLAGNGHTESYPVKVDKTKPTIAAAATTLPNVHDWYRDDVAIKFTCDDGPENGASGVDACPVNEVLTGEGAAVPSTAQTVADLAGNVSNPSNVVTVGIDRTKPTISPAATTPPNGNGWYKDDVTVEFTCADSLSGILSGDCPESQLLTGEGIALASTAQSVTDKAGNVSDSSDLVTVKIDRTKPTISAAATTSPNGNGWYKDDVSVHFNCADSLSGIADGACPDNQVLDTQGAAVSSIAETVTDRAGNTSNPSNVVTAKIDRTPPTISAAATTPPNGNGWYKDDVTVQFTCADSLSGIFASDCPESQLLIGEGIDITSISQTVADKAGNVSSPSNVVTVKIDRTKPTISAAPTTSPNGNGWYKGNVTVQFTCADEPAEIASGYVSCPDGEVLTSEGAAVASTSQTVADRAGNVSSPSGAVTVKIDKTGPGINWAGGINGGDSFYFGSVPAAPTCSATDSLSGPDGCTVIGYSALVGTHTLTAMGLDKAGNETHVQRQYTVKAWTLAGFYQPVDMGGVWNTVKGGSTVPLKFEVFAASELTDVGVVDRFAVAKVACGTSTLEDAIELVTTGGTSFRYDSTAGQFIQNWQTPKLPGYCYVVTMTTDDGSSLTASFKLK